MQNIDDIKSSKIVLIMEDLDWYTIHVYDPENKKIDIEAGSKRDGVYYKFIN